MAKTKKNYTTQVADGRMTLTMNEKRDGRQISASCPYPFYEQVYNEKSGKNEMVRRTKIQTEKILLRNLGYNA